MHNDNWELKILKDVNRNEFQQLSKNATYRIENVFLVYTSDRKFDPKYIQNSKLNFQQQKRPNLKWDM